MESSETPQSTASAPGSAGGLRTLLLRMRRSNPLILSVLAVVIGVAAIVFLGQDKKLENA